MYQWAAKLWIDLEFLMVVKAHMLTPGIPGPMVLCGGLIPPPKFWWDQEKYSLFSSDLAWVYSDGSFDVRTHSTRIRFHTVADICEPFSI